MAKEETKWAPGAPVTRRAFLRWGLATGMAGLMASGFARRVGGLQVSEEPRVLLGDIVDFALASDEWPGDFGFVTFRLQRGFFNNQFVWFIRTDASQRAFAEEQGLLFTPKLQETLGVPGTVGDIYLFREDVVGGRGYRPLPVFRSIPGQPDYSPLFRVHFITEAKFPEVLVSHAAIEASRRAGEVKIERTDIVVNYPVVRWPVMTPVPGSSRLQLEGYAELPHDTELARYLGGGQLIGPVDLLKQTVTFKLHKCFPNFRYTITDASLAGPATNMNVVYSPGLARLPRTSLGTGQVFVFGNGIPGSGPMGFQASIMDPKIPSSEWSPLWDHFTMVWKDPSRARLVTTMARLRRLLAQGELERFNGVPATHPQGFVVNCPTPITAEVEVE